MEPGLSPLHSVDTTRLTTRTQEDSPPPPYSTAVPSIERETTPPPPYSENAPQVIRQRSPPPPYTEDPPYVSSPSASTVSDYQDTDQSVRGYGDYPSPAVTISSRSSSSSSDVDMADVEDNTEDEEDDEQDEDDEMEDDEDPIIGSRRNGITIWRGRTAYRF